MQHGLSMVFEENSYPLCYRRLYVLTGANTFWINAWSTFFGMILLWECWAISESTLSIVYLSEAECHEWPLNGKRKVALYQSYKKMRRFSSRYCSTFSLLSRMVAICRAFGSSKSLPSANSRASTWLFLIQLGTNLIYLVSSNLLALRTARESKRAFAGTWERKWEVFRLSRRGEPLPALNYHAEVPVCLRTCQSETSFHCKHLMLCCFFANHSFWRKYMR